ncbi:nucleotide sugar dehydrogenase [Rhizobium sp. CF142]|uniref:nucleotide sugar dehydrogenase n=1 Tax=Rhizobium sp. CF142 TaxID=1144314 RepID=UPI00026EF6CB|nr:nucleotide sugar dehydrogenase [Rhizobium sp. CF142]EJJ26379.1 nucleotide sugar dehydrogenase [Rhizobium sp. CF142]
MKIAIFGLGYVGLTGAGCLLKEGHSIVGVEPHEDKVKLILSGHSPIYEPGLDDLLASGLADNRLTVVSKVGTLLSECDLAIVCVGTPSAADGSHNMTFIAEVSRQIALGVNVGREKPLTVVFRSTIRPGSIDGLIAPIFKAHLGKDFGKSVEIVYNPEFLRESVAIKDYFNPPKIVVGTQNGQPSERMTELYKNISAPMFVTGYREAEFTKFVDNTWHAVKVAFANEIGRVCVQLDIDPQTVHKIFISDTKLNISPYYMRPGGPFGGSCLPKDVRALAHISEEVGAFNHLVDSLLRSNEAHKRFIFDYVTRDVAPKANILMLGLAFKAESDDLRESPQLNLAHKLITSGYKLSIYDPAVKPTQLLGQNMGYAFSHLPSISEIMVSKEEAESTKYDLVIDTNGSLAKIDVKAAKTVDTNTLH